LTEAELLVAVVRAAQVRGLLVFHVSDSRRAYGAGFPDLCIVGRSLMFVELKSAAGRLKPDQVTWRYRLLAAGQQWRLWRPADWPAVITAELDELCGRRVTTTASRSD
jgi:hypothetical protein